MIAYQTKNPFPLWKYDTTGNNGCQSEYSKMFAHTVKIETVILLRGKKCKNH